MAAEQEEQEEAIEVREPEARDLLHSGNIDGYILEDMDAARSTYNDELLRYNSKFAQLVGKLHSNLDEVDKIVGELPSVDDLNAL